MVVCWVLPAAGAQTGPAPSPALWLEWLRDELPLAELDDAVGDIRALFEKAVDDYIGQFSLGMVSL